MKPECGWRLLFWTRLAARNALRNWLATSLRLGGRCRNGRRVSGRRCCMNRCRRRLRAMRWRVARHRALRIQQMIVTRPQTQADEGAGVGHSLRLPSMVGLVTPHGIFAGLVPRSCCGAAQVVLPDQRLLDLLRALWIDLLLPPRHRPAFSVSQRTHLLPFVMAGFRDSVGVRDALGFLGCRRGTIRIGTLGMVCGRLRCGSGILCNDGQRYTEARKGRSQHDV